MNNKLVRLESSDEGTFGVLLIEGKVFCLTLERPWLNNEKEVSCIPKGSYVCKRHMSSVFGNTFEVMGVEGREGILFHWGNHVSDSRGCILLGYSYDNTPDKRGVTASRTTFSWFLEALKDKDAFWLDII